MPTLSVIIPTFNGGPLFEKVLEGLRAQRFPGNVELLVIDSGSQDGTVKAAKDAGATVIEIAPHEFDHGLTRNRGIAASSGEIVVLMTQDAVPADEHLLTSLAGAFEDPKVGGAFARQIPRPEHDILVARNIEGWIAGSPHRRVSEIIDRASYDQLAPIDKFFFCVFDNVCSAIRRRTWVHLPFQQNAFGEDIEWSKRALESGWKIAYEPDARVIHSHDRSALYEYKRTYMCHQTLYRLFGLRSVPTVSSIPRSLWQTMRQDVPYVWKHEKTLQRKISLLTRLMALSLGSVWGQYRGARDEHRGIATRMKGV
jgi:rhamnosyltransferase